MLYVSDCFANSSLFHKALKEAFEFFCNKNVGGSSTAELMANFCDLLLRKVSCSAIASPFALLHREQWSVSLALQAQSYALWAGSHRDHAVQSELKAVNAVHQE